MGFKIAEAYVEVKADSTGFREDVDAKVKEASLGQKILVGLQLDKKSLSEAELGGLFSNIAPLIMPGVAAVGQLSGAIGLVPAAAGLATASVAALGIGVSGIKDTVKAYTAAQEASGQTAAQTAAQQISSANSIANAQQSLKAAIQAVGDAQRNSANQILSARESLANAIQAESNAEQTAAQNNQQALQQEQRAEEALASAQEAALRAQQNLNDARQAAARSLEDLQNRVIDAGLAQRAAVEQLEKAQAALNAPAKAGQVKDMDALQLAVDQAAQHLKEMNLESRRAQEDQAAAAKAGVDGSKQVVAAQDQVLSSQRALTNAKTSYSDAQQKVTQTELTGQQQIAAANQRVGDAQRALDNAEISGREAVAKAQDQVASAQRSLNQALAAAAAATSTGATAWAKYNAELAKLAPNAQSFLRSIIGLGPAWTALKLDVQQRLFAGLGAEVRQMGTADLPVVHSGLAMMADSLNAMFKNIGNWATSAKTVSDLRVILDNSAVSGGNLARAVQPVLDIIRDLATVGSSFLPQLTQHFANAAQRAADFVSHARDTGKLHEWMQNGIDAVRTLKDIFKDLFDIIKRISEHQGPVNLLDILKLITGSVRWLVDNFPDIIPIIETILVLYKGWRLAQLALNTVTEANPWVLVVAAIAVAAVEIYTHWDAIKKFLGDTWKWITDTASSTWNGFKNFFIYIWTSVRDFFVGIWDGIRNKAVGTWNDVSGFFGREFGNFRGFFAGVWNGVVDDFNAIWGRVTGIAQNIWNGIVNTFKGGVNAVLDLVNRFEGGANAVLGFLHLGLLPPVPLLAGGGTVGSGFATNGPMAIVGEGRPQYPEYVIPTDPSHRDNALALYQSLGAKLMAGGGIIDWIGSTVSKVEKWAGAGATGLMNSAISGLASLIPQPFHDIATGIGGQIVNAIKALVDGSQMTSSGGLYMGNPGSGVQRWATVVLQALGIEGQSPSLLNTVLRRMNQESGGNPNIVNTTDSNWVRGTPSVGLMQVIGPTYRSYRDPAHDTGPYLYGTSVDPLANILASMRYAMSRYGSLPAAYNRPGGYDLGGIAAGAGFMPKYTNRPERVLSPQQTQAFDRLVDMLGGKGRGMGGVTINVIQQSGSPQETGRAVALALRTVS